MLPTYRYLYWDSLMIYYDWRDVYFKFIHLMPTTMKLISILQPLPTFISLFDDERPLHLKKQGFYFVFTFKHMKYNSLRKIDFCHYLKFNIALITATLFIFVTRGPFITSITKQKLISANITSIFTWSDMTSCWLHFPLWLMHFLDEFDG